MRPVWWLLVPSLAGCGVFSRGESCIECDLVDDSGDDTPVRDTSTTSADTGDDGEDDSADTQTGDTDTDPAADTDPPADTSPVLDCSALDFAWPEAGSQTAGVRPTLVLGFTSAAPADLALSVVRDFDAADQPVAPLTWDAGRRWAWTEASVRLSAGTAHTMVAQTPAWRCELPFRTAPAPPYQLGASPRTFLLEPASVVAVEPPRTTLGLRSKLATPPGLVLAIQLQAGTGSELQVRTGLVEVTRSGGTVISATQACALTADATSATWNGPDFEAIVPSLTLPGALVGAPLAEGRLRGSFDGSNAKLVQLLVDGESDARVHYPQAHANACLASAANGLPCVPCAADNEPTCLRLRLADAVATERTGLTLEAHDLAWVEAGCTAPDTDAALP